MACSGDAAVRTCDDRLTGVWRASVGPAPEGGPRRYHIVDHGPTIEVFPMFDSTRRGAASKVHAPVSYTPTVFDLQRPAPTGNRELHGALRYRATRDIVTCAINREAVVRSCANDRLEIAVRDVGDIGWDDCSAPAGEWSVQIWQRQ